MASYCDLTKTTFRILDPGCGTAILTCALIEHLVETQNRTSSHISAFNRKMESIEKIADKIILLKNQNSTAETADLENQIEQLVYQLYDLTEEEIKIVEGASKPNRGEIIIENNI